MGLQYLTLEELEDIKSMIREIKNKRLEEAKRQHIPYKAGEVALYLGRAYTKKHGNYWIYPDPKKDEVYIYKLPKEMDFVIIYDDYGRNLNVYYKGKEVLEVHLGDLIKYVPGEWVDRLNELYAKVEEMKSRKKKQDLINQITKEASEWDIDLDELIRSVKQKKGQ